MNCCMIRKPFGHSKAFRTGRSQLKLTTCNARGNRLSCALYILLPLVAVFLLAMSPQAIADDPPADTQPATQPAEEPASDIVPDESPPADEPAEPADQSETQPASEDAVEEQQEADAEPQEEEVAETQPADTQPATQPAGKTAEQLAAEQQKQQQLERQRQEEELKSKPRIELFVPSWQAFLEDAKRANSGFIAEKLGNLIVEMATESATGSDMVEATSIFTIMKDWPDATIEAFYYVPDAQANLRWALRVDWPEEDLRQRLQLVLESDASETLFKDMFIGHEDDDEENPLALLLPETTLAYIVPLGDTHSALISHHDLELPERAFPGTAVSWENGSPDIVLRFNFTKTEKDSDASFWSNVHAVTDVVYAARVAENGNWDETIEVFWPRGVGMVAKAALGKVKQKFYVPDRAFGAVTTSAMLLPGMVEQMAGFGFDFRTWDPDDGFNPSASPLAKHMDDDFCFTFLPGEGFLPTPDIVIQTRAKKADKIIENVRKAAHRINKKYKKKELDPPWYEQRVMNRTIFFKKTGGLFEPSPVIFLAKEVDDKGREHDILVIGMTSTDPAQLVKEWIGASRSKEFRYLPSKKKPYGEAWVNSKLLYKWLVPYVNLTLSSFSRNALLPEPDEVEEQLVDASASLKLQYTDAAVRYSGPLPIGIAVMPSVFRMALNQDQNTDLARERFACKRLKLLFKQCELFHDDYGRWPAEVAELDGYIDFAGHPYLLELPQKSRRSSGDYWGMLFGIGGGNDWDDWDDWKDDDEEAIDESLYVIDWQPDSWSLGYAPDTFKHLEKLYIDQDGEIHSVPKDEDQENDTEDDSSQDKQMNDSDVKSELNT